MSDWESRRHGPYAAISAGLLTHPKMLACTPQARLLHIAGILYCADELTDGHVPETAIRHILLKAGTQRRRIKELEQVGLWTTTTTPSPGWMIRDYLEWNPSKSWWFARREKERLKKQKQRNQAESTGHVPQGQHQGTSREVKRSKTSSEAKLGVGGVGEGDYTTSETPIPRPPATETSALDKPGQPWHGEVDMANLSTSLGDLMAKLQAR